MSGASERHNRIAGNLYFALRSGLRGRGCAVYMSDMRLLVNETGLYTYPDVMVVCGPAILLDHNGDVLTNPVLIVEVLSESTKDYDRGGKFHQYMRIPSLREYLTVSQKQILVDHSVRQDDGGWLVREIGIHPGVVDLKTLGIQVSFAQIYEDLDIASA